MACGAFEEMKARLSSVKTPLDPTSNVPNVLYKICGFLEVITSSKTNMPVYSQKSEDNATIISIFMNTALIGITPLLASILLSNGPPKGSKFPPIVSTTVLNIALSAVRVLNNFARLDLKNFQVKIESTLITTARMLLE